MNIFASVVWNVDPVAFSIFGLEIRYYGIFWALAFIAGIYFFTNFVRREKLPERLVDSIFWCATLLGIIGARLGHCLFYEPEVYLADPLKMLNIREGGMASHGAAIGFILGLILFSRLNKISFWWAADRIMVPVAIGGAGVRLGNLMNSEIYGRPTDLPWGFIFERNGETVAMHPTQIYEALCYILVFVVLLWLYYKKDAGRKHPALMAGVGLIGIFLSRILLEFIKNDQVAFEQDMVLNMGQWLSIPLVIAGIVFVIMGLKSKPQNIVLPNEEQPKPKAKKVAPPKPKNR